VDDLIRLATAAREQALAPYSGFKVGAAIEAEDGRTFTGANFESASYGLTVCAERVALWKALSEGVRRFKRLAIVTDASAATPPCGACRQVLWEYCGDIAVVSHSLKGDERIFQMSHLLPSPFDSSSLDL
jgi:cytidine deaminase